MNQANVPAHSLLAAVELGLETALKQETRHGALPLLAAARHLTFGGSAKRIRPRLVLNAADVVGAAGPENQQGIVDAAVAGELIHTASLLHDDVVDDGTLRRGRPTANALWGNAVAVLSGDLLLSVALGRLRGYPAELTARGVEVVLEMSRASMLETQGRRDLDLGPAGWREIALGKTGALFGWCCAAPAWLTGNRDFAERLSRCGMHLGVAFQLADDILDLEGSEEGDKNRFADLTSGNPSFPILTGAASSRVLRDAVARLWEAEDPSRDDVVRVGALLLAHGCAARTREAIGVELEHARAALGSELEQRGAERLLAWASERWGTASATERRACG